MGSVAVVPEWVLPPAQQVMDYFRIAYAIFGKTRSPLTGGHAAAMNWVTGGQRGPVTGRTEQPVTRNLADAEQTVAMTVAYEMPPMPESMWVALGVEPRAAATDDREWANGVNGALGWLLGRRSEPVLHLPRRLPDGSTPSADQLYAEMLGARPYGYEFPEQRQTARSEAETAAARYWGLAALADSAW